jgi:hypothetical protein
MLNQVVICSCGWLLAGLLRQQHSLASVHRESYAKQSAVHNIIIMASKNQQGGTRRRDTDILPLSPHKAGERAQLHRPHPSYRRIAAAGATAPEQHQSLHHGIVCLAKFRRAANTLLHRREPLLLSFFRSQNRKNNNRCRNIR